MRWTRLSIAAASGFFSVRDAASTASQIARIAVSRLCGGWPGIAEVLDGEAAAGCPARGTCAQKYSSTPLPWCMCMKSMMRSCSPALRAVTMPSVTCAKIASHDTSGGSWSCGLVSPGSRFSMKYFGCSDLPRSWKYAPTRTSRPFAPIAFAAISAMFAIIRLCCHVPGDFSAICLSSGCDEVLELDQLALRDLADEQLVERDERHREHASRAPGRSPRRATASAADRAARRRQRAGRQVRAAARYVAAVNSVVTAPAVSAARQRCFGRSATTSPAVAGLDEQQDRDADVERHEQRDDERGEHAGREPDDAIEHQRRHHREQRDRHDEHRQRASQHHDLHDDREHRDRSRG